MRAIRSRVAAKLAAFLNAPQQDYVPSSIADMRKLARVLRKGDVVLVEGDRRISRAIKYLTTSNWSHAALFVDDEFEATQPAASRRGGDDARVLVEADVEEGVRVVPLSTYAGLNVRICRPVGLTEEDQTRVVRSCLGRLGDPYDVGNIVDLARYLFPYPPVPQRVRRYMLSIGAGDPTRAICSTLIARAFERDVRFPVLPMTENKLVVDVLGDDVYASAWTKAADVKLEKQILHARQVNLYVPKDFDVSPFFEIVKPNSLVGWSYKDVVWADDAS